VTPAVPSGGARSLRNGNDPVQNETLARLRVAAGPGSRARAASFQNLTPGHGTDPLVTGRFTDLASPHPPAVYPYVVSSTPPHGAAAPNPIPLSGQPCAELPARHRSMSRSPSPIGRSLDADDDDDGDTCTWRGKLHYFYYNNVITIIQLKKSIMVLCCCESTLLAC